MSLKIHIYIDMSVEDFKIPATNRVHCDFEEASFSAIGITSKLLTDFPHLWRSALNIDRPMTDWRDLPLTISSQISGGWMENIQRVDSRISVNDFQDRMPRTTVTARSALTNRMGRFRTNNGLASWNCRDGTQRIKDIMLRHLTAEQVRENTTMGYDGLTKEELAEIERRNEASGKYDKRAGKNGKRRR